MPDWQLAFLMDSLHHSSCMSLTGSWVYLTGMVVRHRQLCLAHVTCCVRWPCCLQVITRIRPPSQMEIDAGTLHIVSVPL